MLINLTGVNEIYCFFAARGCAVETPFYLLPKKAFMKNRTTYLLRLLLLTSDCLVLNGSVLVAKILLQWISPATAVQINWQSLLALNGCWLLSAALFRLYSHDTMNTLENVFRQTWRTLVVFLSFAALYTFIQYNTFLKSFLIATGLTLAGAFVISRLYLTYVFSAFVKRAGLQEKIAILGYNDTALQLADYFQTKNTLYRFEGFFDDNAGGDGGFFINDRGEIVNTGSRNQLLGTIEDCIPFAVQNNIREIYSTILPAEEEMSKLVEVAERNLVRVKFVSPTNPYSTIKKQLLNEEAIFSKPVESFANMEVFSLRKEPLQHMQSRAKKRIFDIVFSFLVITFILSWLTPIIALLIKMESRGPVFFRQLRSGRNNQPFWCFKFRSMTVNKNSDTVQASKNDARITKVGAFLRKTSLDELPQFWNVLLGDMSIVGPRPHMLKHTEEYSAVINNFMMRHFLKPGITGWAQVNGFRGETREDGAMQKRVEHDLWYMQNWSQMLDVRVIFMTIINIFKGEETAY
jgi:putative colanic acid biosysnthesis UDP-glucose lipid carrier transferase